MDDYINREALLKKLYKDCPQICDDKVDLYGLGAYSQYQGDINTIVNMPSVDAVQVVRCKDCKYRNREYICKIHYLKVIKEFYCASGVKKNETN